ncbi:hypothetical protein CAEBREN_08443 [Caenorhabditis brenneri]|uniref:SET domain-containing protein n=1 Tax=Caenorhabditis brenneri TaxID=135651 RepID=G0MDB5_CAEBE|nr:hypothetical protein CAEBREN_08443 [Caenorhabditis brenneri]
MICIKSVDEITSEIGQQILDLSVRYPALRDKDQSKVLKVWTIFVEELKKEMNIKIEVFVARDFLQNMDAKVLENTRKSSKGSLSNQQNVGWKTDGEVDGHNNAHDENQPGPSNRSAAPFALRAVSSSSAKLSGVGAVPSRRLRQVPKGAPYSVRARAPQARVITPSSDCASSTAALSAGPSRPRVAKGALTAFTSSADPSRSLVSLAIGADVSPAICSATPSPNKVLLRPRASQGIPACSAPSSSLRSSGSRQPPVARLLPSTGPSTSSSTTSLSNSQRHTLPVAILVTDGNMSSLYESDRLKVVQRFEAEVPASCVEALRAAELGREIHRNGKKSNGRDYPGVPSKKFTVEDAAQYGRRDGEYEVQTVYEIEGDSQHVRVCFEGWQEEVYLDLNTISQTAKGCLEDMNVRRDFLSEMERKGADKEAVKSWRYCNKQWTSIFWDYDDLSYFHTVIQRENGLGPVFYISLNSDRKHPPKFSYTTSNIMDLAVYKRCLRQKAHLSFEYLEQKKKMVVTKEMKQTGCENPEGCVCNRRFEHLYGRFVIKNLQTDQNGRLEVRGLTKDSHRISIECSDACGCSHNCPRRHMQRSHQKPFVVYYEGPQKGNSLRAGAKFKEGEFIGEYNGHLKIPVAGENQSYEASVEQMVNGLVICARTSGNCIRFMSHSCNPNAMFVVTWSRVKETDPLLPRIAVFATRDIKLGEEVTICYWTKADVEGVAETIDCWCNETTYCIGKIPCRSDGPTTS